MCKKSFFCAFFVLFCYSIATAQEASPLFIGPDDLRLEEAGVGFGGGFHLYIRKKDGINSVMLTETTKDPLGVSDNYAYRALEWNAINGDERRVLNEEFLNSPQARYSLIDSTTDVDSEFGECFHIYIPPVVTFGYSWSRHGTIELERRTFINIRTFALPYGDYRGEFYDNPFMFDLGKPKKTERKVEVSENIREDVADDLVKPVAEEVPILTDDYNPLASYEFESISDFMIYSKGPETIVDDIMASIMSIEPKNYADIVFVIDSTGSMKDDIETLRKKWIPKLVEGLKEFTDVRLGLTLYRDYGEAGYNYRSLPVKFYDFTRSIDDFLKNLNSFVIHGNEGGDIPEAVYEGIYAAVDFYKWRNDAQRKVILIGDAEPHPSPRGTKKYSKNFVMAKATEKKIAIDAIIVPDNKKDRGR